MKNVKVGEEFDVYECCDCGTSHPRHITTVTVSDGGENRARWPHWIIVVALIFGIAWFSVFLGALGLGYFTNDYSELKSLIELTKQMFSALISMLQGSKK